MKMSHIILGVVGAAIMFVVGRSVVAGLYTSEKTQLSERIDKREQVLAKFLDERRNKYPPIAEQLRDAVDRTLGDNRETVEAALRAKLNRLGERFAIAEKVVSTGRHSVEESPAKRIISRENPFRNEPDFCEVEGTIRGQANLETAMRLTNAIESEPWIKRIDSIDLDPRDNGEAFDITLRLTTIYVPGRAPDAERTFEDAFDDGEFDRVASFVAANHFAKPSPPPVVAQASPPAQNDPPAPPPPPEFPYWDWRVTGVVYGSGGWEVWLVNGASSASQTLVVGQTLGDLTLVAASDEEAIFQLGESRFTIRVGSNLNDRTAIQRTDL